MNKNIFQKQIYRMLKRKKAREKRPLFCSCCIKKCLDVLNFLLTKKNMCDKMTMRVYVGALLLEENAVFAISSLQR